MFGIKYIKAQPNTYLLQFKKGNVAREGAGLSFFYFSPASSIVAVPLGSMDIPFIFNEVTSDFQEITIQGEITYKVSDPKRLSNLLNYTLGPNNDDYSSDDPEKLLKRIINQTQVMVRAELQGLNLKAALQSSEFLEGEITKGLADCEMINQLGVEILALSILAIKPNPETSRALEAEIREKLLMEADEAIYDRRNAAVEQERTIKENELNTEVAVEIKKREIRETKLEAERVVQEKRRLMKQDEMTGKIVLEEKNREYVSISVKSRKEEADAQAYGINAVMGAFKEIDPRIMQALANINMDPSQLIAAAFQNFAENASKIGNLNIAPELLRELLDGAPSR
jgi:regulator of protease activity HflC (stomatin/prohibitin superfamily)